MIKIPIYNTYGTPVSIQNKRLSTHYWFICKCPNCDKEVDTDGQDFLYVPETNPYIHFYCDDCSFNGYMLILEKIEDDFAYFKKNEVFKSKINVFKNVPTIVETL